MNKLLRIALFTLSAFWILTSFVNLQLRPTMNGMRGGFYQFTTWDFRGWPRCDALTQTIHSVQSDTSPAGALRYGRTVTNEWQFSSLALNVILSILLVTASVYCLAIISFDFRHIQFSISTVLVCVTALAITLAVLTNEQGIHRFTLQYDDSQLPDFYMRSLGMLGWNDRIAVASSLFFTAFLCVLYTAKAFSSLFIPFLTRTS